MSCIISPAGIIGPAGNVFVGPTGPTGPTGSGPTGPPGPVNVQNTLYVDGTYGNDSSAQVENLAKPFLLIQTAINNSSSGDRIVIQHGTYNESITISGKNLTLDFKQSTINTITISNSVINIIGFPTITNGLTIDSGSLLKGKIKDISNIGDDALLIDGSNTKVKITCRDIETDTNSSVEIVGGELNMKARDLICSDGVFRCVYINSGGKFIGSIRDASINGTTASVLFAIETDTDSSNSFIGHVRDIYTPLSGNSGGGIGIFGGKSSILGRDIIERSVSRGQINSSNSDIVIQMREVSGRNISSAGQGRSTINFFQNCNCDLILWKLDQLLEAQRTSAMSILGNNIGNQNIKIILFKIMCAGRGNYVYMRGNNNGSVSYVRMDSVLWIDIGNLRNNVNNEIFANYNVKLSGFEFNWDSEVLPAWNIGVDNFDSENLANRFNQPIYFNLGTHVGNASSTKSRETFSLGGAEEGIFHLNLHNIVDEAATLTSGETGLNSELFRYSLIFTRGKGRMEFEIDRLVNNESDPFGGLTFYINETPEVHFYNTFFNSPSLAIAIEHDGTTGPAETLLNNAAKVFFHGSSVIIGNTGTSPFNTDSTSIVTVSTDQQTVVINEGRINTNITFETSAAKSNPVVEPITGPSGAKVINSIYYELFNTV